MGHVNNPFHKSAKQAEGGRILVVFLIHTYMESTVNKWVSRKMIVL